MFTPKDTLIFSLYLIWLADPWPTGILVTPTQDYWPLHHLHRDPSLSDSHRCFTGMPMPSSSFRSLSCTVWIAPFQVSHCASLRRITPYVDATPDAGSLCAEVCQHCSEYVDATSRCDFELPRLPTSERARAINGTPQSPHFSRMHA